MLRARGVRPGEVVAIEAHRSAALVRAVLGVLASGAAWVILDRDDPEARREVILEVARPKLRWSTAAWVDRTDPTDPSDPLPHAPEPEAPAYVAFTSGSTGRPKGIVGSQRPLSHFMAWHVRTFGLGEADRFSLLSGLAHDPLLRDLFTPLWLGATLAIPSPDLLDGLGGWLAREAVTTVHWTPALAQLVTEPLPALRRAFFGGDALRRSDVARLRTLAPDVTCVNFYGATETPQAMGWHVVDPEAEDDGRPLPLGRGIDGVQLLVRTAAGALAGIGEVGEIFIRTPYLALGYLDDPALTRERFLPDHLYRTGDLGAFRLDGQVRSLGRADRQIKIRGYRVEPAEIEAALLRLDGVRAAYVLLAEDRLAAYVVPASLSPAGLRQALRAVLPPYLIPADLVPLDALPLTPNGKVDRAALPAPERESDHRAPRTPIETLLAEIWAGVLGVERIGADDDFFALGGHSLLATQVVSRVRDACGVDLPLRALFEASTLAALAGRIEDTRRGGTAAPAPIRPLQRNGDLPLSFAQQRLWFLDQMEPGNPNLHLTTALRLTGPLHTVALAAALQEVVRRHETLRTTFGVRDGRPWQVIAPELAIALPVVDLGGLAEDARGREERRVIREVSAPPFVLERGPLVRAALLDLAPGERTLVLTLHHIVSDGWSTGVLCDELTVLYEALRTGRPSPLAPLAVQYVDFAAWQRNRLQGAVLAEQLAAWRATLGTSGFPVLELPTDRPRPAVPSFRGARRPVRIGRALTRRLRDLGRSQGATLFMVLLAAFQTLLHRISGQDELLVGSPVANRTRVEVERLIGMFFNLLAFRADLRDAPPFTDLLARVREAALTAYLHQDLPFEKLLEELQPERQLSRTPLFQATLVLQNAPRTAIELPGLTLTPLEIEGRSANFDLNLQLTETAEGIAGWLEFRTDLFDAPTIDRLAAHLLHLLAAAAADPGESVARLPLLAPAERFQLLTEWNDTAAPFPADATLHGLFLAQAARTPDAPAVLAADRTLTYRELDDESARLAAHLRARGVRPGTPVAVALPRTADLIPALLGILRAGGFYVPLEPTWPEARVRSILDTLHIEHVLRAPVRLPPPSEEREWGTGGEGFAYAIFTSGSTGVPKGVLLRHRPVVNLIHWVNRTFGVGPGDRLLFVTSPAFDLSVYDVFGILAAGGAVRVASEAEIRDPEALARLLGREPITFWDSAPALLAQVVPFLPAAGGDRRHLRLAFLSGDWIPLPLPGALKEAFPRLRVIALGGATEAAIWSNAFPVEELAPHWVSIPYGRPIANARYHVLDAELAPCPAGLAGDLYIGGDCLADGYAREPELTAAKFVPDPWSARAGGRLYRTGDRARHLADGNLEFLGRLDHQVKIRGFRVELGEIEGVLAALPGVRDAVVMVREDRSAGGPGDRRLVAYVTGDASGSAMDGLRRSLRERLPDYMVPSAFVKLAQLPLTPNGKVDRQALPSPEAPGVEEGRLPPQTPVEELLAGMWAEMLGLDRVGANAHFFELGGHSLLATRMISRLRSAFGVELPLNTLFLAPVLADLAAQVETALRQADGRGGGGIAPLAPARREGPQPLSFAQQRLWFVDQLEPGSPLYNIPAVLRVEGRLDPAVLALCLGEITRRHEALRTTFAVRDGAPVQVIEAAVPFVLPVVDLSGLPENRREAVASALAGEEARRPFDLTRGLLLRGVLLHLAGEDGLLALTLHHIASDGWSMGILVREVAALYAAFAEGRPSPLPELPVQYADFALWQRSWLQGEVLEREIAFWRRQLDALPPLLELPTDRPHPPVRSSRGGKVPL
ncbi:MAG TPA: non-ribosomal peptide synthetase, partial [Acidobacteria bacterium]|nr:non-ribosomal peptide synthetase [Acidobacteriota bacterium]